MKLWVNGEQREVSVTSEGTLSVAQLVSQLGWPTQRVAVERNGNVVPKTEHTKTDVQPGDKIEVVTLIGGG